MFTTTAATHNLAGLAAAAVLSLAVAHDAVPRLVPVTVQAADSHASMAGSTPVLVCGVAFPNVTPAAARQIRAGTAIFSGGVQDFPHRCAG